VKKRFQERGGELQWPAEILLEPNPLTSPRRRRPRRFDRGGAAQNQPIRRSLADYCLERGCGEPRRATRRRLRSRRPARPAAAFDKRDDGLLWRRLANRAVLRPSADNGFVNLDNLVCTAKRAGGGWRSLAHGQPDATRESVRPHRTRDHIAGILADGSPQFRSILEHPPHLRPSESVV